MKHTSRASIVSPMIYNPFKDRCTPLCLCVAQCHPTIHKIITNRWKIMHNDFILLTPFPNAPTPVFRSIAKLKSFLSNICSLEALGRLRHKRKKVWIVQLVYYTLVDNHMYKHVHRRYCRYRILQSIATSTFVRTRHTCSRLSYKWTGILYELLGVV